jgi:tetratricopeptide (TPR) repeat protein
MILGLGGADLCAASHKTTAKTPAPTPPATAPATDAPGITPKDMLLSPDGEKQADALAEFIQGTIAEDNADIDGALDAYRKVLAVDPTAEVRTEDGGGDTLMLLSAKVGFELARGGDPASGIDLLKDTIKASPKDPMAYYYLAQLYERFLRKYDIALKYAQQALDLDPSNFSFYVVNYELDLDLGQAKKADDILERASKMQSDDPDYWLQLSELTIHATVKDNTPIAPDDLKKMNALFQKTVELAKDDPFVLAKVADFDVMTRQVKEAIPLYQKVLGLKGDSTDPVFLSVREKLAGSYMVTGQKDDAIKTLQDLARIDPLSYSTYESLGKLYVEKEDYEHALDSYQQTLLLNPKDWRNYILVEELMLQLKKNDKAVDLMKEAHEKFPDLPIITYRLAMALAAAKKNQEAVTTFEQAMTEAQISDNDLLNGEFYFNYGAAAEQAGEIPKAAELFKKTIALDPTGKTLPYPGAAYNYLGFMWVDRDQNIDEGGELIKRALEMEPGNAAYIDSLGWYYYKKGQPDKALEQLLKAEEGTKPEDPEVDDHVASTYQKLGNIPQALNYWQKAVALDPDNKAEIEKKIDAAKVKMTSIPAATPATSPATH